MRPANFYYKEKVPESPDVRLGSPLDPQSWPLNEGWVVPFDKVLWSVGEVGRDGLR